MNGIIFQNTGLWPWAAAVSVPILIHLLTRRPTRVYTLPTFRFLARSAAKQTRLFRLQRPLLLAARTLFVLCLVLAFLKPTRIDPLVWTTGARRSIILVADTSLSMGYTRAGVSSLSHLRGQAAAILDGLRPGDVCDIVLAGRTPHPVLPEPGSDFGALRYAARGIEATSERADIQAALNLAADLLRRKNAPRRDLVVLSDFQKTNWNGVSVIGLPSDVHVTYVKPDIRERPNTALTDLRLQPDAPRPGEEATLAVEAWNGAPTAQSVTVTLNIEGDAANGSTFPPQHASVTAPAFGAGVVTFRTVFPSVGIYKITASIPPEGLPGGDARYLVADLRHGQSVLLISDTASVPKSAGYYMMRALNPAPDRPGGLLVNVRRGAQLSATDLSTCDVAVLCDAASLTAVQMGNLARWVKGGGSLIAYLAGPRAPAQMQSFAAEQKGAASLPFVPRFPMDVGRHGKGFVTFADIRYESPLLSLFQDPGLSSLRDIRFTRFCMVSPPVPDAEVLITFSDSTPALARRKFGAGSVLLCDFSPAPSDGSLAGSELFPALTQEFVRGMSAHTGSHTEFSPGEPVFAAIEPGPVRTSPVVTGPTGKRVRISSESGTSGIVIANAAEPGIYTVASGERTIAALAVNPPRQESDLRSIDPRSLASHGNGTAAVIGAVDAAGGPNGTPLWPGCLVAAMLFAATEQCILAYAHTRVPQNRAGS